MLMMKIAFTCLCYNLSTAAIARAFTVPCTPHSSRQRENDMWTEYSTQHTFPMCTRRLHHPATTTNSRCAHNENVTVCRPHTYRVWSKEVKKERTGQSSEPPSPDPSVRVVWIFAFKYALNHRTMSSRKKLRRHLHLSLSQPLRTISIAVAIAIANMPGSRLCLGHMNHMCMGCVLVWCVFAVLECASICASVGSLSACARLAYGEARVLRYSRRTRNVLHNMQHTPSSRDSRAAGVVPPPYTWDSM